VGALLALVHLSVSTEYLLMTVGIIGTGGPSSPLRKYMASPTRADAM
jgi:hypothetical protein